MQPFAKAPLRWTYYDTMFVERYYTCTWDTFCTTQLINCALVYTKPSRNGAALCPCESSHNTMDASRHHVVLEDRRAHGTQVGMHSKAHEQSCTMPPGTLARHTTQRTQVDVMSCSKMSTRDAPIVAHLAMDANKVHKCNMQN